MDNEELLISDFINGVSDNYIDKVILRTVNFKGWVVYLESEDIIQNIRLKLLKEIKEGKYRGEGLTTFVKRVSEVQCLLALRRHRRDQKYQVKWSEPLLNKPDSKPDALTLMLQKETRQTAMKVLRSLEKTCRKLIFLKFFKALSYREISTCMKIPEIRARVYVHRCLIRAKEILDKLEQNL